MTNQTNDLVATVRLLAGMEQTCPNIGPDCVADSCPHCHGTGQVPLIPGLRWECPVRPLPSERSHAEYNRVTGKPCLRCNGVGWLPVDPKEAAWVLMDQYRPKVVPSLRYGWVCFIQSYQPPAIQSDTPWEAVINAAAAALLGAEDGS